MFVKFIEYNIKSILATKSAINSSSQEVAEILGNGELQSVVTCSSQIARKYSEPVPRLIQDPEPMDGLG